MNLSKLHGRGMAYLVDKQFLEATQDCFENAIATGILQLGRAHPEIDQFTGHAFLEKKKLWVRTNRGFCIRFSPDRTCMTSALVRSDVDVPEWLSQQLRQISQISINIALEFQKACLRENLFTVIEIIEDELEILDDHQLILERGMAGLAYSAGAEAAERSIEAARISNDPAWRQALNSTEAPGKGLVTSASELSGNPNAQGFAAEYKVINAFNSQAAATESPYRAVSTESFGGKDAQNAPDIQIVDLRTGDVVDEIQVKSGTQQYVSSSIANDRYEGMHRLHNLEAGEVNGGDPSYISPDHKVKVSFTQEEARLIAKNPHDYVNQEHERIHEQLVGERISAVAQTLSTGAVAGAGMSAAGGFAECLGALARGDAKRSETILRSIPERTKDGALRSLGRAGVVAVTQALLGANPLAAGAGLVGADMVRCFGSVLNGQQTPEDAFRDMTPRTLGTIATVSLCMANPAIAVGIVGYRFAYGFIQSYAKAMPSTSLIPRPAN